MKKINQLWVDTKDGLPTEDGIYLIWYKGILDSCYPIMCSFSTNLHGVDKYDFPNKRGCSGFYTLDSDYGFYEFPKTNIIAWTPCPKY